MQDRPGRKPQPAKKDTLCPSCKFAKDRFRESCYCVKYGIVIGYSKKECRGYKLEQVRKHTNGN